MAVELGSISLDRLTHVSVSEQARLVQHPVPGLAGDLIQVLGRPSVRVGLEGLLFGEGAADQLKSLRTLYLAGEPVDFFADAVGEGYFAQVVISRLQVAERSGEPDQFTYACEVLEYVEPPEPAAADPFGALDSDLLGEAAGFMDDVQNAIEQVSQLADLVASFPSFGDPTSRLSELPTGFTTLAGGDTLATLAGVRDLF